MFESEASGRYPQAAFPVQDVEGHPFVGPAGGVLDRASEDAGIDRADVYVTNVVKHFRWKPAPRGKRIQRKTRPARTAGVPALAGRPARTGATDRGGVPRRDRDAREEAMRAFVADLTRVAKVSRRAA
jgi:DNA polymerase